MNWPNQQYRTACRLQKILIKDIENPETKAAVRALSVRAWDCLEERKRIMKGKPLPKPIDTTKVQRTRTPPALAIVADG